MVDRSRLGKLSRRKGARFELDTIKRLREALPDWVISDRGLQCRGGKGSPDVLVTGHGLQLHLECKTGARPNLRNAWRQADGDRNAHSIPVAVAHWDRGETLVALSLDSFVELLNEIGGKA